MIINLSPCSMITFKRCSQLFQVALLSAVLMGCGDGSRKNLPSSTDSLQTDTSITAPALPADSVTVNANNSDTYPAETITLVQSVFQSLFKDDLDKGIIPAESRRFTVFEYDLNNDGVNELFAGLTGPYFCGSGGCTFYIMTSEGQTITRFTVSDYPVLILDSKTNGWHNLSIISRGKKHIVKFDGKKYPANPSVQPIADASETVSAKAFDNQVRSLKWFDF